LPLQRCRDIGHAIGEVFAVAGREDEAGVRAEETARAAGARQRAVLDRGAFEAARAEIAGWPGYAPTRLVSLDAVARMAGVATVFYKDESARFGLGSFKALGAPHALVKLLQRRFADRGWSAAGRVAGSEWRTVMRYPNR
jgi:hypothetical protein